MKNSAPIGIFDSGVGGLTVVRALRDRLPHESILYLGDSARVPYGTKSPQVVQAYARNCTRFLVQRGAKAVVIACNTASAVAVEPLRQEFGLPILGVIEPGATMAAAQTQGRVGIIGTEGTIRSGRYQTLIRNAANTPEVVAAACPLFVPFAEEGMHSHPATELLATEYLSPMLALGIDTLVLGCTHYPVLTPTLQKVCGPEVRLVDSATAIAQAADRFLGTSAAPPPQKGALQLFATDINPRFTQIAAHFLGEAPPNPKLVDLPTQ